MRIASVPEWVVERCDLAAVAVYAALDLHDGSGTQTGLSALLDTSQRTVKRALTTLEDSGAIVSAGRARYTLRREPPTDLSTDLSTRFQQGEAAQLGEITEFSSGKAPTTTTEVRQRLTSGVEGRQGEDTTTGKPSATQVPKLVLVRGRNLGFDALSESCSADPRSRAGEITAALKRIRPWAYEQIASYDTAVAAGGEPFEQRLAAMIRGKAQLYTRKMQGATLTPTALAKWWFDLEKLPAQGLTPEQIASGEWSLK